MTSPAPIDRAAEPPPAAAPGPARPLRVLFVNHLDVCTGSVRSLRLLLDSFPPGAVEAHVVSLSGEAARYLAESGAAVATVPAVSLLQNVAGIPIRGIHYLALGRALLQLRGGPALAAVIRRVDPDLVHLNDHGMYQAAYLARRAGKPVVMHVRCVADRTVGWPNGIARLCMRRLVDRVIAIDESVRLSIREIPSRVVYNPAVSRRTRAEAPRPREPSGSVRVSFLAGLEDYKGLWDLLGAARLLRERRDVVFQIFGRNRWPQDFYRSPAGRLAEIAGLFRDIAGEAEAFIRREGLEGTVRLMGVAPPEEALARTDVVVFPSRLNGVGRSVFEAGLLGIPGIVTLRDRVEDIVEHGVTGLIAPEADPPALAAAIRTLADDPALRARMGEAAREKYARQFDGPRIAEEVLAIYREVLARTGPRA